MQACHRACIPLRSRPRPLWPWSTTTAIPASGPLAVTKSALPTPRSSNSRRTSTTMAASTWMDHETRTSLTSSTTRAISTSSFFDSHPPQPVNDVPPTSASPSQSSLSPPVHHPLLLDFDRALAMGDSRQIAITYRRAREAKQSQTQETEAAELLIPQNRLRRAAFVLLDSHRSTDAVLTLVELILRDIISIWGHRFQESEAGIFIAVQQRRFAMRASSSLSSSSLGAMRSTLSAIRNFREEMGSEAFGEPGHWVDLFDGRAVRGAYEPSKAHKMAWRYLRRLGVTTKGREDKKMATSVVRDAYIRALFRSRSIDKVLLELQHSSSASQGDGLFSDDLEQEPCVSLGFLLDGLCRAGRASEPLVSSIATVLHRRLLRPNPKASLLTYHSLLLHSTLKQGGSPSQALDLARQLRLQGGFIPNNQSFILLMRLHAQQLSRASQPGGTEEDIMDLFKKIESATELQAGRDEFAVGIETLLGTPPGPPKLEEVYGTPDGEDSVKAKRETLTFQPTPGQVLEAELLLSRFRLTGFTMDSSLALPLIRAYTTSFIPQLAPALALLEELLANVGRKRSGWFFDTSRAREQRRKSREAFERWKVRSEIPRLLLGGCVRAQELGTASHVLRELREAGSSVERLDMGCRERIVGDLFGICQSFEEAFEAYSSVRDLYRNDATDGEAQGEATTSFTEAGWTRIIVRFNRLRFGTGVDALQPSPLEYVLAMLRDTTLAGHPPCVATFTTLLDGYGKSATRLLSFSPRSREEGTRRREAFDEIRATVLALHELMRSLVSLRPDMPLMTALMDAYNRVGLPWQVKEIWNRLLLSRARPQSSTVAVFLDTCARHAMLREARRAWALVTSWEKEALEGLRGRQGEEVDEDKFPPRLRNGNVWITWLECLARCGRLNEAVDEALPTLLATRTDGNASTWNEAKWQRSRLMTSLNVDEVPEGALELLLRFAASQRERERERERGDATPWSRLSAYVKRVRPEMLDRFDKGAPSQTNVVR